MADFTKIPPALQSADDLRELLAMWDDDRPTVQIQIMDDTWVRAAMVRVQADEAIALTKAVLLLHGHGMYMAMTPLIRLMWECGITGAWAAVTANAGQGLLAEADFSHAVMMNALAKTAGEPQQKVEDIIGKEWQGFRSERVRQISQRARALDDGVWLYAYYRLLSQFSHGDGSLFHHYLEVHDECHEYGHPFAFRNMTQFPYEDTVMALAVVALHLVLLGWDEVAEGSPKHDELAAFAASHGLRSSLEQIGQQSSEKKPAE